MIPTDITVLTLSVAIASPKIAMTSWGHSWQVPLLSTDHHKTLEDFYRLYTNLARYELPVRICDED